MSTEQIEDEVQSAIEVEEPTETEVTDAPETEEKADTEDADDDVIVSIGEDAPPQEDEQANAPEWVRELRKANREDKRRIRELEDKLKSVSAPEPQAAQLSKKPTLEDHDYDAEKFESALESWYEQKRKVEEQQAKAEAEVKAAQDAWAKKVNQYNDAKNALKVKDFADAEEAVVELLDVTQQGIIVKGAENPALVIYALGRNRAKAKELAAIKDPVEYAFAVAKLETQLKVTQRKAPPPERTVSGTGRVSGTVDSTLERLRDEAAKTGDFTKVIQYRNQQKRKQA